MEGKRSRNVTPISESAGNGPSNGSIDSRIRTVEKLLERIDERTKTFATREDVLRVRIWVISGVAGGIVTLVLIAATVARLLVK